MPASGYRSQEVVVLDKKQIEIKLEGKGEEQQHCCPDNKWCPIKMPHQRIVLANIGLVLFSFYFFYHFTSSYLNSTISPIEYDFPREHSFENPSNPGRSLSSSSSTMTAIQNIVQKFQVFGKEDGTEDAASSAGGDNGNNPGSAATSGKLFQGNKIREYPPRDRLFRDSPLEPVEADNSRCQLKCANWAVATTIFEPSEAVRRLRYTDLCVVVVGDKTKPESYKIPSSSLGENVIFLDAEDQMGIGSGFVAGLPWKHFGRKNVGYLFAIGCGAKSIWDFDDDNIFKFWLEGASPDEKLDYRTYVTKGAEDLVTVSTLDRAQVPGLPIFNPYPFLGCPQSPCWPRGFPLTAIVDHTSHKQPENLTVKTAPFGSIGVLQSLAEHEPDVDAIFRSVMPTPMDFKRLPGLNVILLPPGIFTPYNAQATFHFYPAFFGLYLPVTVHGRVSDIWRSYITQALFQLCDLQLGFLPRPLVVQDRNVHSVEGDFNSEIPLYTKTRALVEFMDMWTNKVKETDPNKRGRFEELAEDLWIELYERDFLEHADVGHFQAWVQALNSVGYRFPSVSGEEKEGSRQEAKAAKNDLNLSVGHSVRKTDIPPFPAKCEKLPSKRFWNSDLHDGCRMDTPTVLANLNQTVVVAGFKGSSAPYPHAFSNKHIWIYDKLSPLLKDKYIDHSYPLNEQDINSHLAYYKGNPAINSTDAFICSFPASMCQIWMPLNKSIIFTPAHRYNLGRCSVTEWTKLNEDLKRLSLEKRNVIGGMSRYDVEYLKYYTNLDAKILSSYSGYYMLQNQKDEYKPSRPEILYIDVNLITEMPGVKGGGDPAFKVVNVHKLYPTYEIKDLLNHRAMVLIPYSVMSYKFTEFYALGLPIFVPSLKYFRSVGGMGPDRASTSSNYCKSKELALAMPKHTASAHPYNPNLEFQDDIESELYWLQFSDFYEWPHVTLFDDVQDLENKLKRANFSEIHELMMEENKYRKHQVLETWCDVIPDI